MGKRIIVQRRGRGSPVFRAPTFRRIAPARYLSPFEGTQRGMIEDIFHDPGRGAPLGRIKLEDGSEFYTLIPEGMAIGQEIFIGNGAPPEVGNILPIGLIPEGSLVCNLELSPGDGGKLARSSGSYASVVAHLPEGTTVKLPSGKIILLNDRCRATMGVIAGAGRVDKPTLKAGTRYIMMAAKGRYWPRVRGVAMVPAFHPHGGGKHKRPGRPTVVSRHAPPGRKVGLIAAKRTGRGGIRRGK